MDMEKLLGGSPFSVIIRLVIISIIVGVVLAALGLQPLDLIRNLKTLLIRLYDLGFDAIDWIFGYFLIGAVIVIPIWLIMRLFAVAGSKKDNP